MSKISVSTRTLRKILRLKTHPIPMSDAKNKLEILAVKTGLKPAFQEFRQAGSKINPNPLILKQLAILLGLKYKSTPNPPLYLARRPEVPSSFLKAYYVRSDFESFWIYRNPRVEQKISECIIGRLNEGYVLGYPECCIKWHEEARIVEVESSFRRMESYAKAIIDKHLIETWERFPFVPHWACAACLNLESRNTETLNQKYRKLALSIGHEFEKDLIRKVKQVLQAVERSNHPLV